ncbi:CRISPR-associated protein Cas4 [Nitrospirillum bahiense]|uniref:CRISPR-associated exonuclease Cas4 n=1 Tax=Nitrospirillum amazonense TaxID=28077 RepID=A0A560FVV9_9PROT|nr:CRISPR-associated protein Cas4 [Nitrospirillum amazonense]TWB25729.1 CRISPR-associated Cas4 family exonuclease [Nitrospirillum amazonense]
MEDEDPIPLSALQHHLFCPRQCALIHVERQWAENASTAEGRVLHERVDQPGRSYRDRVRTVRSLPLRCRRLNLIGVADVVEFQAPDHRPYPVEFKRGRPKAHRADEVQLCAQALCLEEMFGQPVMEGALFYGEKRRRMAVAFDTELRTLTERVAADVHTMIDQGRTPPPVHEPSRCRQCSLIDLCQPRRLAAPPSVADWLRRHLRD